MKRRLLSLAIAIASLAALAWSAQRLQLLGAPLLPAPLARLASSLPNPFQEIGRAIAATLRQLTGSVDALVVGLLQFAVVALAVMLVVSLITTLWRGPRRRNIPAPRPRPVSLRDFTAPVLTERRCEFCGLPARDAWQTCPRCGRSLAAARAS